MNEMKKQPAPFSLKCEMPCANSRPASHMGVGGEAAIHNEANLQNTQVPLVLQIIRVAECHFSLS